MGSQGRKANEWVAGMMQDFYLMSCQLTELMHGWQAAGEKKKANREMDAASAMVADQLPVSAGRQTGRGPAQEAGRCSRLLPHDGTQHIAAAFSLAKPRCLVSGPRSAGAGCRSLPSAACCGLHGSRWCVAAGRFLWLRERGAASRKGKQENPIIKPQCSNPQEAASGRHISCSLTYDGAASISGKRAGSVLSASTISFLWPSLAQRPSHSVGAACATGRAGRRCLTCACKI